MNVYSPIEVAIALSLYGFNVSVRERAQRLFEHFEGDCAEVEELEHILLARPAYAATEFALPTAAVYVTHALERYGNEAKERASYL